MYDPDYKVVIYYVIKHNETGEVFISHISPYPGAETLLDQYTTVNGALADYPGLTVYAPMENDADRK